MSASGRVPPVTRAARFLRHIVLKLIPESSDPAEVVSGFGITLIGLWCLLPASQVLLAHASLMLINQLIPLSVWGCWMIALGVWQWLAVARKWKHGRIIGIWAIMMTRAVNLILAGELTHYTSAFVPEEAAYVVLALFAYLKLRL